MPTSFVDPKDYVRQVPIPVASHKGVKIQARSHSVYNATLPTRDEVRRENYKRRQMQMSQQGFRSVNNKPYQGLGDPFYLEPKKLVLHALGQWDETIETGHSSSNESNDEDAALHSKQEEVLNSTITAMRLNKDANELSRRLAHGSWLLNCTESTVGFVNCRQLIRTVSLGRSFRQIVRKETENKAKMSELEMERAKQEMRNTLRPPKLRSSLSSSSSMSSSESDNDVDEVIEDSVNGNNPGNIQDINLKNNFQKFRIRPFSSVTVDKKDSHLMQDAQQTKKAKSASHVGRKGPRPTQRPYTPQHSNIAATCISSSDKDSVFRQLSVLYWLLEAMNVDPPRVTRPISSCWNVRDFNETDAERLKRLGADRVKRENKLEAQWKFFSSTPTIRMLHKRMAKSRVNALKATHLEATHTVESSSVWSASDVWDQRSHLGPAEEAIQEDADHGHQAELIPKTDVECTETSRSKCPSPKFRETYMTSPSVKSVLPDSSTSEASFNNPLMRKRLSTQSTKAAEQLKSELEAKELERLSRHAQIINFIDRTDEESRLYRPPGAQVNMRAEASIRPKSSAALVQYQATLPSNQLKYMVQKMKMQFTGVVKEQEMILKDALDAVDRNRLKDLERKFDVLPTDSNVRIALHVIRSKDQSEDENKAEKQPEIYQPWFLDLMKSLSGDMKNIWYFQKILDKISRYGLVESGKQSAFKFIRVLAGLREWEVCAPDISAAIEFCREKVVEMTVEEYEKWFHEAFPTVVRPQPVVPKKAQVDKMTPASRAVDRLPRGKSAPPGGKGLNGSPV